MKRIALTLALLLAVADSSPAVAEASLETDPAYLAIEKSVDLSVVKPQVNVNLPRFLLKEALAEFNGGPDDPFAKSGINVAELIRDVKLIRVLVFEGKAGNKSVLSNGVAALRRSLDAKWTPIAVLPEDHVSIHALADPAGESVTGLSILVNDGDTVIINVVGRVPIGKLIKLAGNSGKLPKDVLKKLMEAGSGATPSSKPETTEGKPEPAAAK